MCKRNMLIIPSISLERSLKESIYFSVLLAYIDVSEATWHLQYRVFGKKRWYYPYAISGGKKVISQLHEEYVTKLMEI